MDIDFSSIDSQIQICSSYIASQEHKGWIQLSSVYQDVGWSGGNVDRPGLQNLLSDIDKNEVDVIVIYKMDRLTRSLSDFVRLAGILDKRGVTFVSVTQSFDTSDPMGRMVMNIILTFAQFEREMIGDRVRDKVRSMRSRGLWTGGSAPFGYNLVDKKLVINKPQAEIVKKIYQSLIHHGTFAKMQREIIESGLDYYRSPGRNFSSILAGKRISSSGLHKIVRNCVYIGKISSNGDEFEGMHEAIISMDVWNRAKQVISDRKAVRYRAEAGINLLRGILFDEYGRRMLTTVDRRSCGKYRYYKSSDATWSRRLEIAKYTVRADYLDDLATSVIKNSLRDRAFIFKSLNKLHLSNQKIDDLINYRDIQLDFALISELKDRRIIILNLVQRCEVHRDSIKFLVRCASILGFLEGDGDVHCVYEPARWRTNEPVIELTVPVNIAISQRFLPVPLEPDPGTAGAKRNASLISVITDARRAQDIAYQDRGLPMDCLAEKLGLKPGPFARLLRLNYLAPDIIAAILDGRQPKGLTRKTLIHANLPMDWDLQRELLGFTRRPNHELSSAWSARQTGCNLPNQSLYKADPNVASKGVAERSAGFQSARNRQRLSLR